MILLKTHKSKLIKMGTVNTYKQNYTVPISNMCFKIYTAKFLF